MELVKKRAFLLKEKALSGCFLFQKKLLLLCENGVNSQIEGLDDMFLILAHRHAVINYLCSLLFKFHGKGAGSGPA
jgi:hypothetical protein